MHVTKRRQLRRIAFTNQNCLCFYCQLPMWEDGDTEFPGRHQLSIRLATRLKCTAEHLVAQQDGGQDTTENIVAACAWCNNKRHAGRSTNAPNPQDYKHRVAKLMALGKWHPAGLALVFRRKGLAYGA